MNKKLTAIFALLAVVLGAVIVIDALPISKTSLASGEAMYSQFTVTLYGTDKDEVGGEILAKSKELGEKYLSAYDEGSEIYRLNAAGQLNVSELTARVLQESLAIAEATEGAFNPAIGRLTELWKFEFLEELPPEASAIQEALTLCDYNKIVIDGGNIATGEGQRLDLGAVGKGAACDEAYKILEAYDIQGAIVSAGGTILTYGKNPRGGAWTVGIRTPVINKHSSCASVEISGVAYISTSGSYERFSLRDDNFYHHILSSETGFPADTGLLGVTVVTRDSGLAADALSTACFVLGYEKALDVLEKMNAQGIFITTDNHILVTEGLREGFKLIDTDYIYEE